ncbi:MAG: hypothetical protein LBO04_02085 [Spirochaetaceae bacterium]|jgi:hypothetical protein|nr:hypothetical protein [Spirochaetaceae bacterium]
MAAAKDLFPATRDGQLAMAKDWKSAAGTNALACGIPPAVLTELDALIKAADTALGLKPRDTTPGPRGAPAAQVTVETHLIGRHEPGVKIVYVTGNPQRSGKQGLPDMAHPGCPRRNVPRKLRRFTQIFLHQTEKKT